MLAIKNFCYKKHSDIIEKFFLLAEDGRVPPASSKGHLDGWGVGWYEKSFAKLYKSGKSVVEEKEKFFSILNKIKKTKVLLIHFRKSAWKNTNSPENSHPFKYKNILFAHNGTIYDYIKLVNQIKTKDKNLLDSEVFFQIIINKVGNTLEEKFKKAVETIKKECKYSSLTCIFSDGKKIYGYRDFTKFKRYYTLYRLKLNDTFLICSEPIIKNQPWQVLEKDQLFIY